MDNLLQWVTPDETAAEFFSRQFREAVSTGLPFVDAHVTLRPGHLLEIAGPASTAKTEMLIEAAANLMCRAPGAGTAGNTQFEPEHVVVIDCDGKFDTLRLLQVAGSRLPSVAAPNQSLQALTNVLERLHLIRCFSSVELLLALTSLPQYVASLQGRCRLLLIDNIAAYVWQDRAAAAAGGSQSAYCSYNGAGAAAAVDVQRVQSAVATMLTELSQQLRFPVVVTKQTAVATDDKHEGLKLVQRELMTAPWQSAVTHRLLLCPVIPADQALSALAKGPIATEVLMQWQAPGYMGAIERCKAVFLNLNSVTQHKYTTTSHTAWQAADRNSLVVPETVQCYQADIGYVDIE